MKKKSLEELSQGLKENKVNDTRESKQFKVPRLFIVSLVLLILVSTITIFLQKPKENKQLEQSTKVVDTNPTIEPTTKVDLDLPSFFLTKNNELTDEQVAQMIEYSQGNFIGQGLDWLPSQAEGFTSKIDEATDENGIPNVLYVPMTKESALEQISKIVYRITHPTFGNWEIGQKPFQTKVNEAHYLVLNDISTEYFKEILQNEAPRLLYLDYNKDYFGGKFNKDSQDPRLVGVIKQGTLKHSADSLSYDLTFEVDYVTQDKDVFDTKTIKLELVVQYGLVLINKGEVQ